MCRSVLPPVLLPARRHSSASASSCCSDFGRGGSEMKASRMRHRMAISAHLCFYTVYMLLVWACLFDAVSFVAVVATTQLQGLAERIVATAVLRLPENQGRVDLTSLLAVLLLVC